MLLKRQISGIVPFELENENLLFQDKSLVKNHILEGINIPINEMETFDLDKTLEIKSKKE